MIKTYLTDRCVAGYPCTAEWGVRPLHSIHCSSNYSHPAGGTPCLCPPVSVLSVSLYIQWPPGLSIFFNSNSCFEANLRVSSFKILAAVEIFLEKVGTNKFYLNLFRVFFYSRIEIYSAQGIFLYFIILHVYTLLFSVALYVYICYYFSFWTTAWHFLVFHIIWIFRHWKFYALLITHPM